MISRVSSTNKEKQAKRKNRTKKQRLNRKKKEEKKRYKETENAASPGVELGSSAGANMTDLLDHCTTLPHIHGLKNLKKKTFFPAIDAF